MSSSLSSLPSLLSFRGIIAIGQALMCFHIFLPRGLEATAVQSRKLKRGNLRQNKHDTAYTLPSSTIGESNVRSSNTKRKLDEELWFRYNNFIDSNGGTNDIPTETGSPTPEPTTSQFSEQISTYNETESLQDVVNVIDYNGTDVVDDDFDDRMDQIPRISREQPTVSSTWSPTSFSSKESPTWSPTKIFVYKTDPPSSDSMGSDPIGFVPVGDDGDEPIFILSPTLKPDVDGKIDESDLTSEPSVAPTISFSPTSSSMPSFSSSHPTLIFVFSTPIPSLRPTQPPTLRPTFRPSEEPTLPPTLKPTQKPSRYPTSSPTPKPTIAPTGVPSDEPSISPTGFPTDEPTIAPTGFPTDEPTTSPTKNPTLKPTPEPSPAPTETPSHDPTPSGTLEPSISSRPTYSPSLSIEPTKFPTLTPSTMPSNRPTLPTHFERLSGLIMTLSPFPNGEILSEQDKIDWLKVTEVFIFQYLSNEIESSMPSLDIKREDIRAMIIDHHPVNKVNNTFGTTRRFLEGVSSDTPVDSYAIEFDLSIEYRSFKDDYDFDGLVWSAFDSPVRQTNYANRLKGKSDIFRSVQGVEVVVEGFKPPPEPIIGKQESKKADTGVIVGSTVGSVAFIILIVLLVLRGRNSKSVEDNEATETHATPSTTKNVKVSTEILVELQDDISTLGDPMHGQGMMMKGVEKDEMTATVGDDYDYAKLVRNSRGPPLYGGAANIRDRATSEDLSKMSSLQSLSMSKLGKIGDNYFADDASFEEQFVNPEERLEIVAPAGKLGMVIDTPNGDIPVVHAIKQTSVLVDQVCVGDRLLSVDGEDCTGMTAMQVSKLISLKSEKPARVLVFGRSNNTNQPQ